MFWVGSQLGHSRLQGIVASPEEPRPSSPTATPQRMARLGEACRGWLDRGLRRAGLALAARLRAGATPQAQGRGRRRQSLPGRRGSGLPSPAGAAPAPALFPPCPGPPASVRPAPNDPQFSLESADPSRVNTAATDRWPSGRRRTPGKCVGGEPSLGFESLSIRQTRRLLSMARYCRRSSHTTIRYREPPIPRYSPTVTASPCSAYAARRRYIGNRRVSYQRHDDEAERDGNDCLAADRRARREQTVA